MTTVVANVYRRDHRGFHDEAMVHLEQIMLHDHAGTYTHQRSGGMQQRVAIDRRCGPCHLLTPARRRATWTASEEHDAPACDGCRASGG